MRVVFCGVRGYAEHQHQRTPPLPPHTQNLGLNAPDASYLDPLGQMMLGSEDYRYFMTALLQVGVRGAMMMTNE